MNSVRRFTVLILLFLLSVLPVSASANTIKDEAEENFIEFILPDERTIKFARMYMDIDRYLSKFRTPNEIVVHLSPTINLQISDSMTVEHKYAADFFALPKINVAYFTETESSWYISLMNKLEGSANESWISSNCALKAVRTCGMASYSGTPNFYYMIGSQVELDSYQLYVPYHEAVHGFQRRYGLTRPDPNNGHPNCWMLEGQAEALGFASALYRVEIDERRAGNIRAIQGVFSGIEVKTKSELIADFQALEKDTTLCGAKGTGYTVGFLLMEYLYLNFGVESVHAFIKDFISTDSFNGALQNQLGIDSDRFYSDAFDHIIYEYKRVVNP